MTDEVHWEVLYQFRCAIALVMSAHQHMAKRGIEVPSYGLEGVARLRSVLATLDDNAPPLKVRNTNE